MDLSQLLEKYGILEQNRLPEQQRLQGQQDRLQHYLRKDLQRDAERQFLLELQKSIPDQQNLDSLIQFRQPLPPPVKPTSLWDVINSRPSINPNPSYMQMGSGVRG